MSCEDIPSLLDLQNTKKHVDDLGRLMGTGTGTSTNGVTGQVRPTYNEVMKSVGFKPGSGDFTAGFTVMPGERDIAWYDPVSMNWYSYLGVIPTGGHPVLPGTNPVGDVDWKPVTDELLRNDIATGSGASLVGFTQAGTGTANRTVQDKLREIVSLTDFSGFVGDGVADDTAAVIAASVNTNLFPRTLTCTPDKIIRITGSTPITFNNSVDLGGATLDLRGYSGVINLLRPNAAVEYLPGSAVVTALQTEAILTGKYFSGWANTDEIKDAFIRIETSQPYYNYGGTDFARHEINHSIRHGIMMSPLTYPLPTSLITKVVVYKNEPRQTRFGNFTLKVGQRSQLNMFVIMHSHFRLHDIHVLQDDVTYPGAQVLFNHQDCLDLEVRNVTGNWASLTATTGAYVFGGFRNYDFRFVDCAVEGDGWGAVGTSSCQRMSFRRCDLNRVDSHHPFIESLDIDDCRLGMYGVTASGIGDLNITDTEFLYDEWPGMVAVSSFVRSRPDVGGLMAGNLNISRCKFRNDGGAGLQFLIAQLNTTGGVTSGSPIPYQFCASVNMSDISIDSATEINIFPKVQQSSGCKVPSKLVYDNVRGANLICWEQGFAGLTPAFASVTSQVNNIALRGAPNVNLSLREVTLSRKGISLAEQDATQDFLFDIAIDNLRQQSGETVYPEIELYVGGEVTINGSIIEGLDFFLGALSTKPIHLTMNGGAIRHTGAYNSTMIGGFNGFQKMNFNGVHLYGVTASSLQSSFAANVNGCLWFLNDAAYQPDLTVDMAGVAGTYTLTNKDVSLKNHFGMMVGSGVALSKFPLHLPAPGGSSYIQTSAAASISFTRSADGTTITTTLTGAPNVRSISLV